MIDSYLMVTSGIKNISEKSDTQKSAINFFDNTPYSARVQMGHEHLVQTQHRLNNMSYRWICKHIRRKINYVRETKAD